VIGRHASCLLALLTLLGPPAPGWARAAHRVSIDIRGPLALVEIERPLLFGAEYGRAASDEVVVDLDLPEGAALAGAEVRGSAASMRLAPAATEEAGRRHAEAVQVAGWRAASVALDEGVDFRLKVAAAEVGEGDRAASWSVRYRFLAPLSCRDGQMVLAIPGALDPAPTDADVDIRLQLGRIGFAGASAASLRVGGSPVRVSGGRVGHARTSWSVRRAWEIAVVLPASPPGTSGAALAAGSAVGPGQGVLAAAVCRAPEQAPSPAASKLLVLIDRSRSVGPGGAAVARDLARALVLALPPTLAFNAVFFDRTAEPLFALPRSATLEALSALEDAVGLGTLRNGTDLPLALRQAAQLTSDGAASSPTYWVVITDGALPDHDTSGTLAEAVAGVPADRVQVAMLILRQDGDDPVSPAARRALAEVPARLGGVLRELPTSGAGSAAPAIVLSLRGPGDLINPAVSGRAGEPPLALSPVSIPPGSGGRVLGRTTSVPPGSLVVRAMHAGAAVALPATVVPIDPRWARALLPGRPAAWAKRVAGAAAVMSAPMAAPGPEDPTVVRGRMERDVVQRVLGYAFLPRARACYLTRAIRSASDFQLKGRLRLELHLERGEMMGAAVRRSTLGRPDIEACLREAAFAVEIPRALHSDAPVIAALNLVFRPRTEPRSTDGGVGYDAIDRILGPMPPPSDPMELLIEAP
jgi:hypothetical protein